MLLIPHCMLVYPLCYLDQLLAELEIVLVQEVVGQKVAEAVEVELALVQDFVVEMALVDVAGIVGIGMVVEGMVASMVVDIDIVEGTLAEVASFHDHIPSNPVQVVLGPCNLSDWQDQIDKGNIKPTLESQDLAFSELERALFIFV